jgi:hypothetical protein
MERIIAYLAQMLLVSGVLATYYCIALRNRKLHKFNRAYLLGAFMLSVLLPLMPVNWAPSRLAGTPLLSGSVERIQNISRSAQNNIPWLTIGGAAIFIVSGFLLMVSLHRISTIFRLKTRWAVTKMPGYHLIHTDDTRAPFSFLNNLFWRRDTDPRDLINARIYQHELAHIKGLHSWDSLFAQLLCNLCWINPFFWLMRRELKIVHEFIADEATGMRGDAEGFARMLLSSINEGRWLQPGHSFFQSPIKRRLIMLCNIQQSRFATVRKLLVVPMVIAVTLAISCSKKAPANAITLNAIDQAKIDKEKLDLKVHAVVISLVVKEMKQREAAAEKAGLSQLEYKKLVEQKTLEAEKNLH